MIPTKKPCTCGDPRCKKFLVPPLINCVEATVYEAEADEIIETYRNAARLKFLLEYPLVAGILKFKKRDARVEYIDQQMEKTNGL